VGIMVGIDWEALSLRDLADLLPLIAVWVCTSGHDSICCVPTVVERPIK
jgi:hypothetical protein